MSLRTKIARLMSASDSSLDTRLDELKSVELNSDPDSFLPDRILLVFLQPDQSTPGAGFEVHPATANRECSEPAVIRQIAISMHCLFRISPCPLLLSNETAVVSTEFDRIACSNLA